MNKVRFGLIGAGNVGKVHAKALESIKEAELVTIYSRNKKKSEKLASEFNCEYSADIKEILERNDIEAVIIALPSALHADVGIAAAKNGKHVVVEKPVDVSLKKTDNLINECKKRNVLLSVIFQRRFSDSSFRLKKAVKKGYFGKINFGAAHTKWYRDQSYYENSSWRGTWKLDGGGALINQSIHYVDLLRYIVGEIEEVFAYSATRMHDIEVEDILTGTIKYKNGALGFIEANTAAYPGLYSRIDVYGEKGIAVIQDEEIKTWKTVSESYEFKEEKKKSSYNSPDIDYFLHQKQLINIVESIQKDEEPAVTGIDGRNTLAVVLALYESSRKNLPQKVEII
ncbi:hypothetical protein PW5551_04830 [Petrotoga sp. 9PW.55.5.1]|uniref:Gfo/Idh/MocA family protein n=1 Tax=Petrotoga sp. 9PW.55.5.1 TaxID=1308979 RepID=UPI000DC28052|nr:Gfo/Idh/MocA family oxidoreductase [Petrotoga sp. 9PW.55.5.1]RAO99262.1 hypothetical protein PW5551_04830 [Petrotoga sp. 9PW.55.5.1]